MKITVDHSKCTGLGLCEAFAPEVFEVDDNGELVLKVTTAPQGMTDAVRQAVQGCPTEALRLEP